MIPIDDFDVAQLDKYLDRKDESPEDKKLPAKKGQPQPGDIANQIHYSMQVSRMKKIDTDDVDQVKKRIDEFFNHCRRTDTMPTKPGLALALGTTTKELDKWIARQGKKPEDVIEQIAKALDITANIVEQLATAGKSDKVFSMFTLKSNFDYRETSEINISAKSPLEDTANIKKLAEKYADSVVDDDKFIEVDYKLIEEGQDVPELKPPKEKKKKKPTAE